MAELAAVAVQRHRLEAQLPAFHVDLFDVLDRGFLREVDRLADRAGEKGLGGRHHPDMAHRGQEALAVLAALVGAVENRQVLGV